MEDSDMLWTLVAVIFGAVLYVARSIALHYGSAVLQERMAKYLPYAMMAAKWVEEKVPDDYGAGTDDPKTAKALHKLDLFLKKFNEIVTAAEGKAPNEALKAEAMKWSTELAARLSAKKAGADA